MATKKIQILTFDMTTDRVIDGVEVSWAAKIYDIDTNTLQYEVTGSFVSDADLSHTVVEVDIPEGFYMGLVSAIGNKQYYQQGTGSVTYPGYMPSGMGLMKVYLPRLEDAPDMPPVEDENNHGVGGED
jgi:hypothetical protein